MGKREFVQLAKDFDPAKVCVAGYMWSIKLDGMRCFWDGGITRGLPKSHVPWANNHKDKRYIDLQYCTGLWSRYGNVIHAPCNWLDQLPPTPLDGELYSLMLSRQEIMSIVKKLNPDPYKWKVIKYYCFDSPSYEAVFADGEISSPNYNKVFKCIIPWLERQKNWSKMEKPKANTIFKSTYKKLQRVLKDNPVAIAHAQEQLSFHTEKAEEEIKTLLEVYTDKGEEGLMVRNPSALYYCKRTWGLMKLKKLGDAEGTVIGYTTGRETDKGSKLLGKMGALILEANYRCKEADGTEHKIVFEISGFTDAEREFGDSEAQDWAMAYPGERCPEWIENPTFPRGSTITFRYRGFSDDGIPQEARYYRKREDY